MTCPAPHATQVPAVVCSPGGVEAEATRSPGAEPEPQWVLAESPEPRSWATRCVWVAPALTTLRGELRSDPLACVRGLSWRAQLEFFGERARGPAAEEAGEGVPKA